MPQLSWKTISNPNDAPSNPGVYQYLQGRKILYIGKAVNLKARLKSHAQNAKHDEIEQKIVGQATAIKYTLTDTDFLALILEAKLIQKHQPPYNRSLKDNKSYLYIVVDLSEDFPKPRLIRGRDLPKPTRQRKVFGPFGSARTAEQLLRTIRRLVPFCQQKQVGKRACFYHKLDLCDPCPSTITTRQERLRYRRQLRQLVRILNGQLEPVLKAIEKDLKKASEQESFELALALRDKLYHFRRIISSRTFKDTVIESYSNAHLQLEDLEDVLKTRGLNRIEAYDASTFQLAHSVVSMVVAEDGKIDTSQYRRFKIKNPRVKSDFAMLEEALKRRLNNRWPRPDLLVIDGGRPQLRRLQKVLDQVEDPPLMIGLAKHPDKIVRLPDSTINLDSDSPALHLLQRLRDEAHRFANSYRKLLEKKSKQL